MRQKLLYVGSFTSSKAQFVLQKKARPRLFLCTGNKEKTGNEVTFHSQVSDVVYDRKSETD